jgi:hypothetical protein
MAIENDFLPFAVGSGANVLSQSAYAALTAIIQNGYQSGIANSSQMNKTWRQSSIMASVLAQFIVQQTGQPAIDDGTTATLLENLTAAVGAQSVVPVGAARNLSMNVTTASATATMTAEEIVVGSALGGLKYTLASFNKTINLATTGAGGMDTGTAPVSGWIAIYAIYNPTTGTSALLATNATSVSAPEVYGGANRPAGYTASALVSVWNTNGSGQFVVAVQLGRCIDYPPRTEITISTATSGFTQSGTIADIPLNARFVNGSVTFSASTTGNPSLSVAADASGSGTKQHLFQGAAGNYGNSFSSLKLTVARAIFFALNLGGATGTATYFLTGYEF